MTPTKITIEVEIYLPDDPLLTDWAYDQSLQMAQRAAHAAVGYRFYDHCQGKGFDTLARFLEPYGQRKKTIPEEKRRLTRERVRRYRERKRGA